MYPNTATRLMDIDRVHSTENKKSKGKRYAFLVYGLTLMALVASFFADAKVDGGMEKEKAVAQTRTSLVQEIGKALQQKDAESRFFRLFNGVQASLLTSGKHGWPYWPTIPKRHWASIFSSSPTSS